jgi:hypothetical protein
MTRSTVDLLAVHRNAPCRMRRRRRGRRQQRVTPPPVRRDRARLANFGRDVQHAAQSGVATQICCAHRVAVARRPRAALPREQRAAHPLRLAVITTRNTVVIPVKLNRDGGFRVEARVGASGAPRGSAPIRLHPAAHDWTPSYNIALARAASRVLARRGRQDSSSATMPTTRRHGASDRLLRQRRLRRARAAYDAAVIINTPLTVDPSGNVYFGFVVTGSTPLACASGFARVSPDGTTQWVAARRGGQRADRQAGDEQRACAWQRPVDGYVVATTPAARSIPVACCSRSMRARSRRAAR